MDTLSYFSNISGDFADNYNSKRFRERKEIFLDLMKKYVPDKGSMLLDLGCGPGLIARDMSFAGYKVKAVDGAEDMIRFANERVKSNDYPDLTFSRVILPDDLPKMENDRFDGIYSSSFLEYIEIPEQVLEAISKNLKNGATLIISVPNKRSFYRRMEKLSFRIVGKPGYLKYVHKQYSEVEFSSLLSNFGLEKKEVRYFGERGGFWKILRFLPKSYRYNLFAGVYTKSLS